MKRLPLRVVLVVLALTCSVVLIAQNPISIQRLGTTASGVAVTTTLPITAASLPLPSGAATSALQTTINTTLGSPFQAGGSIGNTTFTVTQATGTNLHIVCDGGTCGGSGGTSLADEAAFTQGATNITPIGGLFKTVYTSLTTGQAGVLALTAKGAAQVSLFDTSGNSITPSVDATTNTTTQTTGPQVFGNGSAAVPSAVGADGRSVAFWTDKSGRLQINGDASMTKLLVTPDAGSTVAQSGTWTVQPGNTPNTSAWLVQTVPGTTNGLTTFVLEAAASDNHTNVKNGAGVVYHVTSFNNSATINYYRLYNAASGFNGCNSATNLLWEGLVPASTSGGGFVEDIGAGITFSTGISICITGAFGNTNTTNATASAILFNMGYK